MNKHLTVIAMAAMVLQGCAAPAPPPQALEDFNIGIAKSCKGSVIDPAAPATPATTATAATPATTATIEQTNDGWCAVRTKEKDGKPYKYGLLKTRPTHGYVVIQQMGGETRLEYTAMTRYVGPDTFTVALVSRDPKTPDTMLTVTVNTTMGEGMALPPPPPAPAKPAAKKR